MQRSQADLLAAALETPLFRGLPAAFVEHAIAQGYVERFAPVGLYTSALPKSNTPRRRLASPERSTGVPGAKRST